MAKKRFQKKKIVGSTDRSIWYSDLAYLPPEQKKSAIWMAQMIFYGKRNSTELLISIAVTASIYSSMLFTSPIFFSAGV